MSRETSRWLNTNTLIGQTAKRGNAWHYRAEHQGAESNHYAGAIPVEDVQRRLFGWEALPQALFVADINSPMGFAEVPGKQAVVRSDNNTVLGIHGEGYQIHQFSEWLLHTLANLIDDDLQIGSAGLLKSGAVAWVSIESPDTLTTPEGVTFRPNILAASSHDGSLATTYKPVVTNTVCDNTMSAALREAGPQHRVRHTRNSAFRLQDARDALGIIHTVAEDFQAEVAALTATTVTPAQWKQFVEAYAPIQEGTKGRSLTMAENKREDLTRLWKSDERVSPWAGTAWGVVQAVNTYVHHEQIVRGADRAERNMLRAISGGVDKLDNDTVGMLNKVLVG